jgi:hypothetical protein
LPAAGQFFPSVEELLYVLCFEAEEDVSNGLLDDLKKEAAARRLENKRSLDWKRSD